MNVHQKIRKSPAVLPLAGEIHAMMRGGKTQSEIARQYEVSPAAISKKLRRAGFDATRGYGGIRVVKKRDPVVTAIMEQYPAPSVTIHPDRVTRITNGAHVTMPRVTFIDGPAA